MCSSTESFQCNFDLTEIKERLPLNSAEPKRICCQRAPLLLPECHSSSCEPAKQVIKHCWLSGPQIFSSDCCLLYMCVSAGKSDVLACLGKMRKQNTVKKKNTQASSLLSEQDRAQIFFPSIQNEIMVCQVMKSIASIMGCMPAKGIFCGPRSRNWAIWCTFRL